MVTVKYGHAVPSFLFNIQQSGSVVSGFIYPAAQNSGFLCVNVHHVWIVSPSLSLRLSASIEMSCYLHFCCRQTGSSHNSQECLRSLSVCTQLVLHGLTNETRAVIFLGNSLHSLNRPQRDLSIYTSLEPLQQRGFQNYLHHPIYLTVTAVLSWYGATLYSQQANSLIVPNLSDTMYVQPG